MLMGMNLERSTRVMKLSCRQSLNGWHFDRSVEFIAEEVGDEVRPYTRQVYIDGEMRIAIDRQLVGLGFAL
jgi:hypothetical protein